MFRRELESSAEVIESELLFCEAQVTLSSKVRCFVSCSAREPRSYLNSLAPEPNHQSGSTYEPSSARNHSGVDRRRVHLSDPFRCSSFIPARLESPNQRQFNLPHNREILEELNMPIVCLSNIPGERWDTFNLANQLPCYQVAQCSEDKGSNHALLPKASARQVFIL